MVYTLNKKIKHRIFSFLQNNLFLRKLLLNKNNITIDNGNKK